MRVTPRRHRFLERMAARMRENPTPIEATVWNKLKNRQFAGLWFTNQEVIGRYIVDFYCEEKRLAVEVDGLSHRHKDSQEDDSRRDFELEKAGIRVIRIHSHAVKNDLDFSLERIALAAGIGVSRKFSTESTGKSNKRITDKRKTVEIARSGRVRRDICPDCHGTGWNHQDLNRARPCICLRRAHVSDCRCRACAQAGRADHIRISELCQ